MDPRYFGTVNRGAANRVNADGWIKSAAYARNPPVKRQPPFC